MHALRPRACAPVPRPARPQPRTPPPPAGAAGTAGGRRAVAVSRESISELAAESPASKSDHGARQDPGAKPCGPPASHGSARLPAYPAARRGTCHSCWTTQRPGRGGIRVQLGTRSMGVEGKGWLARQPLTRACILEEMIPLSVLDLSPIVQGGTPALAFRHAGAGAARRAAGLHAVLAGRAPQHAQHRQRGHGRADWSRGGW
jgi:hypothetical protein